MSKNDKASAPDTPVAPVGQPSEEPSAPTITPPGRVCDPNAHGLAVPPDTPATPVDRLRAMLQLSREAPEGRVLHEAADALAGFLGDEAKS